MEQTRTRPNVVVVADDIALAQKALEMFVESVNKALQSKDRFHVAISGGHTPIQFFRLLTQSPQSTALPWDKIHLFWVDERCVPPNSKDSNYKLAADTFLPKVGIPAENVHRIFAEHSDYHAAADAYEQTIREVFDLKKDAVPKFDLIVLGMGAEGHTGSLFPNSYATFDKENLACVVYQMDCEINRITMTHPVLCAASHLVVLVSGEEKADILKEVLTSKPDEVRYPIHVLWPSLEKITWLVDKAAAKYL